MHIIRTYTGKIGWNGATGAIGDYLQVNATKVFVGEYFELGNPSGSSRIKLDLGTVASDVIVYHTANSADTNKPACRLLANNGSTLIREIRSGDVGLASETGETATIISALVSYNTIIGTDASLVIGAGVTITTLNCIGGETSMKCAVTTATSNGGSLVISGTGAVTTLNIDGGNVTPVSTGTITTCNVTSGTANFIASAEPRTVTTLKLDAPGAVNFDPSVLTITNNIETFSSSGRVQYRASIV